MNPYMLEQNQDQPPNFQKVLAFFFNHLPANFILTEQLRYGQCLVCVPEISIASSVNDELFTEERKRYRYIANNKQIFLMFMEQGDNRKLIKGKCIRIRYENVLKIKLSGFYCGIMLKYKQISEQERKQRVIYIQSVNIGRNLDQQLRKHLIRHIGSRKENIEQYCEKTLLDFQRFKPEGRQIDDYQQDVEIDQDGDLIIRESEIKETKIINLKKRKNQVMRLFIKEENIQNNKKDLLEMYKFYFQLTQKGDINKTFVVERHRKNKLANSLKNLSILKIMPKKSLSDMTNLRLLYNQSQGYKNYKIITPYVPGARKLFKNKDNLVFQYTYFEGYTLRELIKKQKIKWDKKNFKQVIAQIVMALGHLHQCGFSYPPSLDNIMINYDGHIFLYQIGIIEEFKSKKEQEQEKEQQENNQEEEKEERMEIKQNINLPKIEKKLQMTSPEEMAFPELYPQSVCDWWCFGLLLYQIVTGTTYYQDLSLQEIKQFLQSKTGLNFQYLQKKTLKNEELANLIKSLLHKNSKERLGIKNDYHAILDHAYFKGIDKNKLMRRQGEPLVRIRQTKISKQIKPYFPDQNETSRQLKEINKNIDQVIEECVFDLQYQ